MIVQAKNNMLKQKKNNDVYIFIQTAWVSEGDNDSPAEKNNACSISLLYPTTKHLAVKHGWEILPFYLNFAIIKQNNKNRTTKVKSITYDLAWGIQCQTPTPRSRCGNEIIITLWKPRYSLQYCRLLLQIILSPWKCLRSSQHNSKFATWVASKGHTSFQEKKNTKTVDVTIQITAPVSSANFKTDDLLTKLCLM